MKLLATLVVLMVTFAALFAVNITVMMFGWGISASSWPVIFGGFAATCFFSVLSTVVSKALE